jgi:hypothetical protein
VAPFNVRGSLILQGTKLDHVHYRRKNQLLKH